MAARPSGMVSPVFVGRRDELASLRAFVDQVASGTGGLAIVSGEAGVGKSRLLAEALAYAEGRDVRVMLGHCVQLGTEGLPYAPLVEALRDVTRTTDDDLGAVLGPARELVLRLTTGVETDPTTTSERGSLTGSQVHELVLGLVERLAGVRPLLLVLEDLHWSDRSTLELAAFLAQNLRGVPAGLLLSYRSDEVDRRHPLRQLQVTWERARAGLRLELARFDRDEVGGLLTGILGEEPEPSTVDLVYQRSDGNAFLAEEMLSAVSSGDPRGLPPSLKDVLLARLDQLSPATEEVLRLAAVAGQSVPERLLVEVAGIPETEVLAAIREAVDAHLLVVDATEQGYRFRHVLARDAVYDDLLPGEQVRLHGRYADVLAQQPGLVAGTSLSAAGSLAHHAYAALDLPRALDASIVAGREAASRLAAHEALANFERALLIWPRVARDGDQTTDLPELLTLAGEAAFNAGDLDRAVSLLREALVELPDGTDPERRGAIAATCARALRDLGRTHASAELLEQTLRQLPGEASPLVAAIEADLATVLMRQFDPPGAAEYAARAAATAREVGSRRVEADALITLGCSMDYASGAGGIDQLREGLELALEAGDMYTIVRGYINLCDLLESAGRSAEAVEVAEAGLEVARESGLMRTTAAYLATNLAESLMRLGDWPRARGLVDEALGRQPEGVIEASAQLISAELSVLVGDTDAGRRAVTRARAVLIDPDDEQFMLPVVTIEAELAREARDFARARAAALEAADAPKDDPGVLRYLWPLVWTGVRAEAERCAADGDVLDPELLDLASTMGSPSLPTAAYRDLTLAETAGVADPAPWAAAVAAWRPVGWPWQLGYALLRLAEAYAESRALDAAGEALTEAMQIAGRLDAEPLLGRGRQLAQRARLGLDTATQSTQATPPDADDPLARYGLTAREHEVLLLLAAGHSNAQIASRLFISPKTARVHVSNLLGKLGVESRVQAAGVAHRLGIDA